jgi:hypothetical protein
MLESSKRWRIPASQHAPWKRRGVNAAVNHGHVVDDHMGDAGRRLLFNRPTLTIAASRDPDDVVRTTTPSVGANPNLIHVEPGLA